MKKVLIITYYWPPSGGAGVQRWVKFTKYLKQFGIEPFILTVEESKASYPVLDKSLAREIPDDVAVYKTNILDPNNFYENLFRKKAPHGTVSQSEKKSFLGKISNFIRSNFFVPDSRMLWHIHATKRALEIVKQNEITTVITTGPPHSTHLIGLKLKKKYSFKWIVDFRDPWSKSFFNDYLKRNRLAIAKDEKFEKKVIQKSDKLLIVSEGMKNDFVSPLHNVNTIYNGYDQEDFESIAPIEKDKFTLAYTGNFKDNQNIVSLWQSLEEVIKEYPTFIQDFELLFAGSIHASIQKELSTYSFHKNISYKGYVEHQQAIKFMISSSVLLFPVPQAKYNENIITGKIFEYLASQSPMLSIGPKNGKAAQIVQKCQRDPMKDYKDQLGIKTFIIKEYQLWQKQGNRKIEDKNYQFFSRYNQTKELVKLI